MSESYRRISCECACHDMCSIPDTYREDFKVTRELKEKGYRDIHHGLASLNPVATVYAGGIVDTDATPSVVDSSTLRVPVSMDYRPGMKISVVVMT